MTSSSLFTATERLTSLKAAVLGGLCAGFVSLIISGLLRVLILGAAVSPLSSLADMLDLTLLVDEMISALSGAVFALTYRYAVRQDNNVQLKAGVVLAFTLVRGLAQVDAETAISQKFWPLVSACSESFLLFGLTALTLIFATQRQWLAPFGQDSTERPPAE